MYVTKEEIAKAKEMDLLTYLTLYEPDNLVRESRDSYHTRDHDSLKISSEGLWYWFSQGIGGKTALDYLIKVEKYPFKDAVKKLSGQAVEIAPVFRPPKKSTAFVPPMVADKPAIARSYLIHRGIDPKLIDWCIDKKLVMETLRYSNVLFAGYDEKGIMKYANLRGTKSNYKGESPGSQKKYAFRICENTNNNILHIFESAIDLLSFITIRIMAGENWIQDAYLSLGGVACKNDRLPSPLEHFLTHYQQVREITLHLDNDIAGRQANETLTKLLKDKYRVYSQFPMKGKDINEELMFLRNRNKQKEKNQR